MERCDSIASQPSTGRLGWFHQIGSWLGTFSLTKSSPICKRHFSCRFSLQKAPDDKGVSSSSELDQQALPAGHPLPFEKEAKLRLHKLGAARQRVGFRTKPIRELGAGSACSVFTLCVGALLWDADGVDHLVVFLLHLGFGADAGQFHRLQRLIDAV